MHINRSRFCVTLALSWLLSTCVMMGCGNYVSYEEDQADVGAEVEVTPVVIGDLPQLDAFNHYAFAGVIASHTVTRGEYVLIDYTSLAGDKEASYELERYAATLASLDPLALKGGPDRFAFFINAYNVSVIRGVLKNFGGDVQHFSVVNSDGFFKDRLYTLGGVPLSLDQIENLAIRGRFDDADQTVGLDEPTLATLRSWHEATWPEGRVDARLHAALNCGALGCPNLMASGAHVYQARELDAQLEQMTRAWLKNAQKGAGPDGVSMLFTWFKDDFVNDAGSVEAFIQAHREGGVQGVDLTRDLAYDWTLNAPENVD